MTTTVLVRKPGQWRLLRGISGQFLYTLITEGWELMESWPGEGPSTGTVLAAVSQFETVS